MLAAVVAARAAIGEGDPEAAKALKFAVVCSAALPNPYRPLLERLREKAAASSSSILPTLHTLSKVDKMNPPDLGKELAECFGTGDGGTASVLWHSAGHEMPPQDMLNEVAAWLDAQV